MSVEKTDNSCHNDPKQPTPTETASGIKIVRDIEFKQVKVEFFLPTCPPAHRNYSSSFAANVPMEALESSDRK
eukprot:6283788-Pyramimonas_sp.AAC.1